MTRIRRLRRGRITHADWRRLLGNAFGIRIVDHYIATIQYWEKGQLMEATISCCDCDSGNRFRAKHGGYDDKPWMEFALKRMEDNQVLERGPDGTPVWRKASGS
jgi:hypothetical protein